MSTQSKLADGFKVQIWKEVGGYLTCAKIRGRWYYVGSTAQQLADLHAAIINAHQTSIRVQGVPPYIQRLFTKYGMTRNAVSQHMPHFTSDALEGFLS